MNSVILVKVTLSLHDLGINHRLS